MAARLRDKARAKATVAAPVLVAANLLMSPLYTAATPVEEILRASETLLISEGLAVLLERNTNAGLRLRAVTAVDVAVSTRCTLFIAESKATPIEVTPSLRPTLLASVAVLVEVAASLSEGLRTRDGVLVPVVGRLTLSVRLRAATAVDVALRVR